MGNKYIEQEEKRLVDILESFNDEFTVAIEDRAKLCASNFLMQVGAKATLAADGYIASSVQIATATLIKMIDDGFVQLAAGLDTPEHIKERRFEREQRTQQRDQRKEQLRSLSSGGSVDVSGLGQYL